MRAKRKYSNAEITVFWRSAECVHASICYTKLLSVFNPRRRPWIVLDDADNEAVINIVNECPTRALTFMWNNPEKNAAESSPKVEKDIAAVNEEFTPLPQEEEPVEIKVMRNGPVLITGNFKLFDNEDCAMRPAKMASLCRCGRTNSAPYCDGTHFKYQFKDEVKES